MRRRNYWNRWENVEKVLLKMIKKNGPYLPTQQELSKAGLFGLIRAIQKYYGGAEAVAAKLGIPLYTDFIYDKQNNINRLKKLIKPYIKKIGYFPSHSQLRKDKREDIITIIRNMGGTKKVASILRFPTSNKFNRIHEQGYWNDDQIIIKTYISMIEKHDLEHWPSQKDMKKLGYGDLSAAISIHVGGHIKFRETLVKDGINLKKKPRKTDHLKPFQTLYEIKREIYIEGELKYCLLGFVAADGSIVNERNNKAIELCNSIKDQDYIIMWRDLISPTRPIHFKPSKIKPEYLAVRLKINSHEVVDMISNYIVIDNKSKNLIWVKNIEDQYMYHFIRAYIDGDGNISVCKNQRKCSDGMHYYFPIRLRILGTYNFLTGLTQYIESSLGIKAVKVAKKGKENVYVTQYSGKHAERILDKVYEDATIFLKRKFIVWQYIINTPREELERNYKTPDGHYNDLAKKGLLPLKGKALKFIEVVKSPTPPYQSS